MHIFNEKKIKVKILGRTLEIRPLTLKQTICLGTLIGGLYEEIKSKKYENKNIVMTMITLAGPQKCGEIVNVLSNFVFDGEENIGSKVSLQEVSALARAVGDVNDFEAIYANFKSAFEGKKI